MDGQKSCGYRQAPKENLNNDEEREYEQNPLNRDVPQDSFQATPSDDGTASVPSEAAQDMEQTDRTSGQEEAADDREETVVRMTRPQTVAPSSQVTPDFRSSGSPSVVIRNGHHITVTNNSAFNMGPRAPGQFGPHTTVINNAVFNMGPRAPGNCGTHNTVTTNVIINPPQRHFHYHYHDPASSQKQSFDDYIRRAEEAAAYATGQVYPGPGSVFHHLGSTHVQNCSFNNQTFSSYTTVGDNRYTDSDSSDEDGPTVSGGVPVPNRPPRIGPRHAGYIVEGPESDDERETSSPPPPDTVSIMDMNGHTLDIGDAIWFGDLLDMTWAMYVGGRDIVYCQQDKSGIVVREELGFEQAFGKMWHKSPRGMHVFSRKERVERALSKVGEKFGGRLSLPCWAFTGMFYTEVALSNLSAIWRRADLVVEENLHSTVLPVWCRCVVRPPRQGWYLTDQGWYCVCSYGTTLHTNFTAWGTVLPYGALPPVQDWSRESFWKDRLTITVSFCVDRCVMITPPPQLADFSPLM